MNKEEKYEKNEIKQNNNFANLLHLCSHTHYNTYDDDQSENENERMKIM
jgi:hypothetical protein